MPFKKGGYNPTTEYYQAKKPKKIPSEPGEPIQYPLQFKLWLVARAKKEGIRPAFRSVGVLHNNYYRWKLLEEPIQQMEESMYNILYFNKKKGEVEIKCGSRRILTHAEEFEV
jgi:hypothetical protein